MTARTPLPWRAGAALTPRSATVWTWGALLVAALMVLPLLSLAWTAATGSAELWAHLFAHVLLPATQSTLLLLGGVGLLACLIGTACAWLIATYNFPARGLLQWALLLPLAVPTYIIAYAYLDLLHPLGPFQSGLRWALGYDSPRQFRLPDFRHLGTCILLLSLVLYPYVYLSVRAMLVTQAASLIEAARSLGSGSLDVFFRVILPLLRPALAVGVALVLLECLNDIGASEFLGVKTLTVTIYNTWVTRSDLPGAAQIALAVLTVVFLVLSLEAFGRRQRRYAAGQRAQAPSRIDLRGWRAGLACLCCVLPIVFGFVLPLLYLLTVSARRWRAEGLSPQLLESAANTLILGLTVTALTVLLGLVVTYALRLGQLRRRPLLAQIAQRVGSLGYALPGTVLAIALLVPMAAMDEFVGRTWLLGGLAGLVLACSLRFLTIASGNLDAGFARVPQNLDQAARSLGAGPGGTLMRIHLPLLRPALAAAAMLILIDTMKELPASLLLRPLGFETLATWLYADASRGSYEEGALAALMIVLIGIPGIVILAKLGLRSAVRSGGVSP
ncbi:MAG: iron ABC transporter permease [Gammaproteobacteria bacterium]|nr:iron ABC transporter permease [Gammaproteobacteria bacterium]